MLLSFHHNSCCNILSKEYLWQAFFLFENEKNSSFAKNERIISKKKEIGSELCNLSIKMNILEKLINHEKIFKEISITMYGVCVLIEELL